MTVPRDIGPRELDAVEALSALGCAQAVAALGSLTRIRIDMRVPEGWARASDAGFAGALSALGEEVLAVGVQLEGMLAGHLVLALPERAAQRLAGSLGYPVSGAAGWDELAESAVMESGNIVGSAFVSAIARRIGGKLLLTVPSLARGGGRACLERLVGGDSGGVVVGTQLYAEGDPALEGLILVMPEPARLPGLLAALDFA